MSCPTTTPSSSALENVRSRQATLQPLLHFDAKGLARPGDPCMDSDDLAGLWSAFTKCKDHLTDGVRLENLTWRLWHRETHLIRGRRPSVASDALSLRHEPLSDPEAANSSDDDAASLSSVELARNNSSVYFTRSDGGCSSRDTSPVSDVDPGGGVPSGRSDLQTPVAGRKVKRDFLPLLPGPTVSTERPKIAKPNQNRPARSLPTFPLASSQVLPPPRPNSLTPSGLVNIITTILPMDLASEHAKVRAESLVLVTPEAGNLKVRRLTAPEPEAPKPLPGQGGTTGFASAEATPVGTPIKSLMAPRIVNIAPTPPPASPAVSRPSTPLAQTVMDAISPRTIPVPAETATLTTGSPPSPVSPSDTVGGRSGGTPATCSSGGSSAKTGLRPALSKKGSHGRSVRISSPVVRGMERRASGGRGGAVVAFAKRSGSNASFSVGKGKGKGRAEGSSSAGGSGGHPMARAASASSGSSTRNSRSPVQPVAPAPCPLPRMADARPVVLKPLRSVVGFVDPAELKEEPLESGASERSQPQPMASPPVPPTPVNSQASAPLTDAGQSSVASSLGTPAGFPDAPPPTPARHGAHLPTTMTAKSGAAAGEESAAAKKAHRATFFIDTALDTDDEGSLSPRSPRSAGRRRGRGVGRSVGGQRVMSPMPASPNFPAVPPPSLESSMPPPPAPQPAPIAPVAAAPVPVEEDDDEFETESDSDEWGSDDSEEDEEAAEAERAAAQAAFQMELFKKLPVVPASSSNATGIRRAGLSMLFHPELRDTPAPNRNQSALELRRPMRSPPVASTSRAPAPNRPARSLSNFPRPSSLLKSKSSVALPVLAQTEPEMKKISPGAQSNMSRASTRPPSASGSGRSSQGTTGNAPAAARPGAARHPSRLGAQPENMEFSDDDEDDEDEMPSPEQAERLAAVAARRIETRPEPIAPPLSPRTTRRNMLANEMTESVRRNLVWERKLRAATMGVVPGRNFPRLRSGDDAEETSFFSQGYHASGW